MMTIVFVCGDPVVNTSILPLLYRHTSPTTGMMVSGIIAYHTRSSLVLIRSTMGAQRYVHDILQPHVLPLMQRLPGAIFQQYNARPHTTRVSSDGLPWPTPSPDLSLNEHIWDHLGRRVVHLMNLSQGYSKYGTKYLKTSYRTCMSQCLIASHRAFALEGVQ
ncbi:transposable element Tcb2 transposase [Trichonephila clavipes]|nr:transposable element Tcb2 transposase [Trichonephila clavipes]